jgi:hypothetical protein
MSFFEDEENDEDESDTEPWKQNVPIRDRPWDHYENKHGLDDPYDSQQTYRKNSPEKESWQLVGVLLRSKGRASKKIPLEFVCRSDDGTYMAFTKAVFRQRSPDDLSEKRALEWMARENYFEVHPEKIDLGNEAVFQDQRGEVYIGDWYNTSKKARQQTVTFIENEESA